MYSNTYWFVSNKELDNLSLAITNTIVLICLLYNRLVTCCKPCVGLSLILF